MIRFIKNPDVKAACIGASVGVILTVVGLLHIHLMSTGATVSDKGMAADLVVMLMGLPITLLAAWVGQAADNNIFLRVVYGLLICLSIPFQWGLLGILVGRVVNKLEFKVFVLLLVMMLLIILFVLSVLW